MALALPQAELDLNSAPLEIKPETRKCISFLVGGLSKLKDFIFVEE